MIAEDVDGMEMFFATDIRDDTVWYSGKGRFLYTSPGKLAGAIKTSYGPEKYFVHRVKFSVLDNNLVKLEK